MQRLLPLVLRNATLPPASDTPHAKLSQLARIILLANHFGRFPNPHSSRRDEYYIDSNILHLTNPFSGHTLHRLLNRLDHSLLTWEHILGIGVMRGDMKTLFLSSDQAALSSTSWHTDELRSLEAIILCFIFIVCFLSDTTCGQQKELQENDQGPTVPALFKPVFAQLEAKTLGILETTLLPAGAWDLALMQRSLRFIADPNTFQPSHLFWINQLEAVRLDKAALDGLIRRPAGAHAMTKADLTRLGVLLKSCLVTAIEYATESSLEIALSNIKVLAEFATELPVSWFNSDLITLAMRLLKRQRIEPTDHVSVRNVRGVIPLFSGWLRKKKDFKSDFLLVVEYLEILRGVLAQLRDEQMFDEEISMAAFLSLATVTSHDNLSADTKSSALDDLIDLIDFFPRLVQP